MFQGEEFPSTFGECDGKDPAGEAAVSLLARDLDHPLSRQARHGWVIEG